MSFVSTENLLSIET